jgi:hypothetical protein
MLPLLLAQPSLDFVVCDALAGFGEDHEVSACFRIDLDALAAALLGGAHHAGKLALAEPIRGAGG